MNVGDKEEKIICPYDEAHHIMRFRIETHLVKCRKNYVGPKVSCEFNFEHRIPKPELQYHHECCPDRKRVEAAVLVEATPNPQFKIENIQVPVDESWDDDPQQAYDPEEYCQNNLVLRHKDVESAAKRAAFRKEERKRLEQLAKSKKAESSLGGQRNVLRPHNSARAPREQSVNDQLPEIQRREEKTDVDYPDDIAKLIRRIHLGQNKPVIPKNPNVKTQ